MIMKLGGSGILEAFSDIRRDPRMIPHVMAKSAARARRRLGLCSHIDPVF